MSTVTTTIAVKDGKPINKLLRFTRHGAVLHRDLKNRRAFALRSGALEPGMAPYFGSVEYMRAQNWDEFLAALNRWGAPAENQVYADVDGNIGYKPAGLTPRRRNYDGLLPVPGDGRYEWHDFHDMDALPVEFNPERGWVATANNLTLPQDYPIDEVRVGFEWTAPWRYRRVAEVLAQGPHSLAAAIALQRDNTSVLAREVTRVLKPLRFDGTAEQARALLAAWDGRQDPESAAAALWHLWFPVHLAPALLAREAGPAAAAVAPGDTVALLQTLRQMPADALASLTAPTLEAAWADAQQRLGPEPAGWQWGTLHQLRLRHPLAELATGELAEAMTIPAKPVGGSGYSPNAARYALKADANGALSYDIKGGSVVAYGARRRQLGRIAHDKHTRDNRAYRATGFTGTCWIAGLTARACRCSTARVR